jgi:hypothetical protein
MFELPQSQIKSDTFAMMNFLDVEWRNDTKLDQMQAWLVPDKTMTKAEQQSIQWTANLHISLKNWIKAWYYQEYYFQRWRWYIENFDDSMKKFMLLSSDFEWSWVSLRKDEFLTKQVPYIMVWSKDDINAINEQQKNYLNVLYPIITADPLTPEVSKNIFKRLVYKINWLQSNIINWICPYSPSERKAKTYVEEINMDYMPKTLLSNPWADFFTYWLYIQKAEDSELKAKILWVLNKILMDQWMEPQQQQMTQGMQPSGWNTQMANSAASQMISQNAAQSATPEPISRWSIAEPEWQKAVA